MLNRTYGKLVRRGIRGSLTRFLSIMGIVMVGSGFLAGLLATKPDMQRTADQYYDDYRLFDLQIRSTWGLDEADAAALAGLDGVEAVMPCFTSDLIMESANGSFVTRLYGVDLARPDSLINGFRLVEGRLPENPGECLIASPNTYGSQHRIGETYTISKDNKNYEARAETYAFEALTVVGIVDAPQYMSIESEPSTAGSGSVGLVMYVFPECYALDVYTDAFLTVSGAAALNTFSDDYGALIDAQTAAVERLGSERAQARFEEQRQKAAAEIEDARAEYEAGRSDAERELGEAKRRLDEGRAALAEAEQALEAKRAELENMRPLLPAAQYEATAAELDGAETELYARRQALAESEAAYLDSAAQAEQEFSGALKEIKEAEEALAALALPEWFVSDRRDTVSFVSYEGNTEKIAAIAKVFPVFFFLVAALVALTTMTRMVEEERVQIGTLKALGYSKAKILLYYIGYSVLASLGGSVIGVVLGFYTLPAVISNVYGMMYTLPAAITDFYWGYAALIVPISVACTTAATLFACLAQLSERPAALLLPRAPKSGKRILLERAGFVWRRMGFIKKVTARNIFRYKKRLFMTVFGIAGCTALLVTAFGLRDSIHDIVDKQFGELYRYNLSLYLSEDSATETDEILKACLADTERVTSSALFHSESAQVSANGEKQRISLCVPKNTGELKKNIVLRERKTGADVPFGESSVVLTEKLCEQLNVSAGDTVSVENADGRTAALTVSGIAENYVTGYVFLPAEVYRQAFGETPEYKLALVTVTDESPEARDALSTDILQSDRVLLAQFSQTIRESFENTVKSIDSIVVVLIIAAGALAVIVLYNLTNINICEREKELATIKVLGFHENEVAAYIYRETSILALLGILAGFVFGVWLHAFVVRTAEVDAVMFGRSLSARSLLFAALVTVVFTVLVDLIMLPRLKKIDMAKSMKAND